MFAWTTNDTIFHQKECFGQAH